MSQLIPDTVSLIVKAKYTFKDLDALAERLGILTEQLYQWKTQLPQCLSYSEYKSDKNTTYFGGMLQASFEYVQAVRKRDDMWLTR